MSKPLTPGKQTVDLGGSRIRRQPPKPEKLSVRRSSEQELWFGVTGVMLTAAALGIIVIGIGIVTAFRVVTAEKQPFGQCYSAGGSSCVLDGDTIHVDGEPVQIAGIVTPAIRGAACSRERERGIAAAVGLSERLRSGAVTLGPPTLDLAGRQVRSVRVDGQDIAIKMIAAGLARPAGDERGWC